MDDSLLQQQGHDPSLHALTAGAPVQVHVTVRKCLSKMITKAALLACTVPLKLKNLKVSVSARQCSS